MAHFMAGCNGSARNTVTRLAGKDSHPNAFVNGWNTGARIIAVHRDGKDEFDVFSTGGSIGRHESVHVGTITTGKDGKPKFVKAK